MSCHTNNKRQLLYLEFVFGESFANTKSKSPLNIIIAKIIKLSIEEGRVKDREKYHKRLWFFIEKFSVIVVVIFFLIKMSIYKNNFVDFFESIYCVFDWDSINILDNISISKV